MLWPEAAHLSSLSARQQLVLDFKELGFNIEATQTQRVQFRGRHDAPKLHHLSVPLSSPIFSSQVDKLS